MKILLPVDGSEYSTRCAAFLIDHLSWFREKPELHLLHVHADVPSPRAKAIVGKEILDSYYREESEAALAPVREMLDQHELAHKATYRVGHAPAVITQFVKENGISLVVMGTHGRTGLKRLVMGSVATSVIASVDVPVMLVK